MVHGWYSKKQKEVQLGMKGRIKKYIYYKDMEDTIVEVTMVSDTKEHKCKFDDMIYIGEMKEFYKSSDIQLNPIPPEETVQLNPLPSDESVLPLPWSTKSKES